MTVWRPLSAPLALDANLAEAHAVKARILAQHGRHDEAAAEIEVALRLDRESYEVNRAAAYLGFRQRRLDQAIRHYEKAMALMETDLHSGCMLLTCYTAVGNSQAALRVARIELSRVEKMLAQDPNNATAMGFDGPCSLRLWVRANAPRNGSTAPCSLIRTT